MQPGHKGHTERGVQGRKSLMFSSHHDVLCLQQEERQECQDVARQVPNNVEKVVCNDIQRQVING